MNELALFAGAGGGILGGGLLGWQTVCAVERDPYARDVLVARQNDGCLAPFPIWDDVCTFEGNPWRGLVDVVSGGFPCQDISSAGKGAGISGARSGLWKEMARIIGEVRPAYVWVENSPMLVSRGLAVVLADLAAMGYHARWGIVGAHHAGAPHKRDRIWILANASGAGLQGCEFSSTLRVARHGSKAHGSIGQRGCVSSPAICHAAVAGLSHRPAESMGEPREDEKSKRPDWWATEPNLGRVAHGVANRVDRLRCIGNGQVPAVVQLAWKLLNANTYI